MFWCTLSAEFAWYATTMICMTNATTLGTVHVQQ